MPASVTSARSRAAAEVREQLALARRAAPGVVADRPGRDLVAVEEPPADPRVLGRDQRDRPQDLEGAQRDVAEVADGRRDDVQRPAAGARAAATLRVGPSRAGAAGRGSRRPRSAARASRSAAPGA